MPTILLIHGWRFFFYSNEGSEPIHIHCQKGDMECKYWLNVDFIDIEEDYSYNMGPKDKRDVRKIIFAYFEFIEIQWNKFQEERRHE